MIKSFCRYIGVLARLVLQDTTSVVLRRETAGLQQRGGGDMISALSFQRALALSLLADLLKGESPSAEGGATFEVRMAIQAEPLLLCQLALCILHAYVVGSDVQCVTEAAKLAALSFLTIVDTTGAGHCMLVASRAAEILSSAGSSLAEQHKARRSGPRRREESEVQARQNAGAASGLQLLLMQPGCDALRITKLCTLLADTSAVLMEECAFAAAGDASQQREDTLSAALKATALTRLPRGWLKKVDPKTERVYYYNPQTRRTQYQPPPRDGD